MKREKRQGTLKRQQVNFQVGETYECYCQTHNNPYDDLPYEAITLLRRTKRYGTFRLKRTGEIRRCLIQEIRSTFGGTASTLGYEESTMIYGGLYYAGQVFPTDPRCS